MTRKNVTAKYTTKLLSLIVSCALLIALLGLVLVGCNNNYKDIGDFSVYFSKSTKTYTICDISKIGKEKEELIIPKDINGTPIERLGSVYVPSFNSPNLKKLFWAGDQKLLNRQITDLCPELDTVVFTSAMPTSYKEFFTEEYVRAFESNNKTNNFMRIILLNEVKAWIIEHNDIYYVPDYVINSPSPNVYFNLNYSASSNDFSDEFKKELIKSFYAKTPNNKENEDLNKRINADLIAFCEKNNFEIDDFFKLELHEMVEFMLAFMSVNYYEELEADYNMLNHENYLWIDYLEVGDTIKTMPPTPTREGYEFTGWYLDSKCTQKADFKSFVKGSEDAAFYAGWKLK